MAYTRRTKETAIRMMLPPENIPFKKMEETLGLSEGTLKKWRQELRENGHPLPEVDPPADKWSSQDKFLIVTETMKMSEASLEVFRGYLQSEGYPGYNKVPVVSRPGCFALLQDLSRPCASRA